MNLRKRNKTGNKRPQRPPKKKPGRRPGHHWTPKMNKFCDGMAQGMTQTDAARYAGFKKPRHDAVRLMMNPLIIEWLAEHKEMLKNATQNALNEEARGSLTT